VWDTTTFRQLPVTNFAMVLPIDVPEPRENGGGAPELPPSAAAYTAPLPPPSAPHQPYPVESMATNAQVAELVDDLLVFQSETRNMLYAMVGIVGVVVLLTLVFGLVLLFR
jgi:hypothetical protein